jgi:hypothetical protein
MVRIEVMVEILAKGLSAIRELDDDTLMKIMKGYFDGSH